MSTCHYVSKVLPGSLSLPFSTKLSIASCLGPPLQSSESTGASGRMGHMQSSKINESMIKQRLSPESKTKLWLSSWKTLLFKYGEHVFQLLHRFVLVSMPTWPTGISLSGLPAQRCVWSNPTVLGMMYIVGFTAVKTIKLPNLHGL